MCLLIGSDHIKLRSFLVVIREGLKHIQIQTRQIKKMEKNDKIFHLYLYHT